ncbi:MAG: hypothetical protein KatS3mg109_0504 [Pirellulaceae bacterium]|nr:MAG: hypothetical protein KatS3mg109_0504 [Pirellulaceae bacterium]GIW94213.1 MAG: hypothetical protein KatS3mg110_2254 [Pirellulaceae bacterium]
MRNSPDHVIRLRGPWQYRFVDNHSRAGEEGTVRLPEGWAAWLDTSDSRRPAGGWVILSRRFGHPTGIEPNDRIYLRIENAPRSAQIRLNGQLLSADTARPIEVSGLLARNNVLELRWRSGEASGAAPAIQLEIRHARPSSQPELRDMS